MSEYDKIAMDLILQYNRRDLATFADAISAAIRSAVKAEKEAIARMVASDRPGNAALAAAIRSRSNGGDDGWTASCQQGEPCDDPSKCPDPKGCDHRDSDDA